MAPAPKFSPREQEKIILDSAAKCITESSLLDFTMSSISKEAGLSMGSVYKLVQCKEDIIVALATRFFRHQSAIFKQVLEMPVTTPEKIIAITLLNPSKVQVYPFDAYLESFAANELVISRASEFWTDRMVKAGEECEEIFNKCMHDASLLGELMLSGDLTEMIGEINLGCWALVVGHQHVQRVVQIRNISDGTDSLQEPVDTDSHIVVCLQRLLNSYQWQTPLNSNGIEKVAHMLIEQGLR
ncbi:MAG: TetR/AcrR family transcriptional regulator [Paraglaciecola sp.]|nr:TetR/AcrR family transcriptional regulator [Paraglaciecola sp.]